MIPIDTSIPHQYEKSSWFHFGMPSHRMDSGNCSIQDYQETSQYLIDFQCSFAFHLSGYIYMLSFNCYRKKHKTGPGIFILETRVWHIAWWPVRTGTGSPVSVYERFEPDICNITLNHDVGSVFSSIFTGNLVMIFWENMGNVGSWMWQSCSNVRWLPDILLYPRFAAKSLNNCF
jgi:hypothetical protein